MEKIRLGFIGSGRVIRELHWPALARMTDKFEVVDIASRSKENAESFAALCGSKKVCTDYHDLLANPDVEAVVITYPFEMNYQLTMDTLGAGKHVLVEKPMAANLEEAGKMVEWERKSSLVTMVAENFQYYEVFTAARSYIDEGLIGTPHNLIFTSISNYDRNSVWLRGNKWRLNCVGGVMLDKEVHFIAMMRMLLGKAKFANGYAGHAREDLGPFDYVSLQVVFENGAIGTMYDVSSVEGFERNDIVIVGSKGTMVIDSDFENLAINGSQGNTIRRTFKGVQNESYIREFDDFYTSIRKGISPRSTFQEGYQDLQLGLTAISSNQRWATLLP